MTAIRDMTNRILVDLPECPELVAEEGLRDAIDEFYRETRVWREKLPAMETVENIVSYPLVPPTGTTIIAVDSLETDESLPCYVFRIPYVLEFDDAPRAGLSFKPVVALTLSQAATTADTGHAEVWRRIWESGARSKLMLMPNQLWSNPEMGAYHATLFRAGIVGTRVDKARSNTHRSQRVRPVRFV